MKSEFEMFSKKVTFVSFFMQLGIVMVHMNTDHYFEVSQGNTFGDLICQWIYRLCSDGGVVSLSFFMICSAFLLYYNLTKENMLEKVRRRFVSLLVPFVLWNLIGMVFCAIYWRGTEDFEVIFSYIPFQFAMSRYCAVMWFSQALLFFLLFIPVILWAMKRKILGELVLLLAFICGHLEWRFLGKSILNQYIDFEIYQFLSYVPMYLLGAYLGVRFSKEIISEKYVFRVSRNTCHPEADGRFPLKYQSWILRVVAVALWVASYGISGGFLGYVLRMLRPVYFWMILDKRWLRFELKWWMKNNFFMYAIHYFLILAIVPVLCKVYLYVPASNGFVTLWRFVCFFIIVAVCEILGGLLIRFAPGVYGTLTGGRAPKL